MSHSHSHGQLPKSAEAADARSFISAISWSVVLRMTQVMSSQTLAHGTSWKGISCPHPAEGLGLWQCLCRGNADPVAKPASPEWALNSSLPRFGCGVYQSKKGIGFVFLYFCFPSVNTGVLVLAYQLGKESRQVSQNISLWSLGYLHQFWLCETEPRQFHLSEEKSAPLVKSPLFKKSCLQHTSAAFSGLWGYC